MIATSVRRPIARTPLRRVEPTLDAVAQRSAALPSTSEATVHGVFAAIKDSRQRLGLERFRMGSLLAVLEDSGAWQGRTSSKTFRRFLIEEGLDPKGIGQYMKVARRFVLDLQCSQRQLEALSVVSMRTLLAAVPLVTEANLEEVVSIVTTLSRADAIARLGEFESADSRTMACDSRVSRPVSGILDRVEALTLEERGELYRLLGMRPRPQRDGTRSDRPTKPDSFSKFLKLHPAA